ncbi:uncharacterized protein LOC131950966 [Physella acuta]|uniref:uncharacterized protein LOC131950966 n=1 Tax=Physella acuta TaxID=109671 RepID=UPI0027DE0C64|nr:uncharacterized protein LOC131950966 [Physella acuta]
MEDQNKSEHQFIPGHHEAEICHGGEADLHKHCVDCKKNPGHIDFIPVNDINMDHLPSKYRDAAVLESIKTLSALTVMLKVKYTSTERPDSVHLFSGQYPFFNNRGSDVLRTGTGRVWHVDKYTEKDNKGTCPCDKCQHSDTPSKVWGEFQVLTASHVVFDESEVRETKCIFGYDQNDSEVKTLQGCKLLDADSQKDWCRFTCATCDMTLVEEQLKMSSYFMELSRILQRQFSSIEDDTMAIIVSHPHGCPKQVTIGKLKTELKRKGYRTLYNGEKYDWTYTKYTYTTPTCNGSSGATVYAPFSDLRCILWHPHSGANETESYCGEDAWFSLDCGCEIGYEQRKKFCTPTLHVDREDATNLLKRYSFERPAFGSEESKAKKSKTSKEKRRNEN